MSKRNVFLRLWDYLQQYKGALFLAIFLKVFSSVMSVLEPFILGLAITELTANLLARCSRCSYQYFLYCNDFSSLFLARFGL